MRAQSLTDDGCCGTLNLLCSPASCGLFYTMFVFYKKRFLTLLSKNNKLSSRCTGRPGGGEQAPRGGVPQAAGRFDLTSTGCRIAASPRERESTRSTGKRASEERLPQQKVGSDAGRPHGGASVSRRAGQHDDAEKAGTTPGHAKVGNATGPMEMLVYLLYRIFRFLTAADQLRRREWMRKQSGR